MKNKIDHTQMANSGESIPRISLIISFDPKMRTQSGLLNLLTVAADKAEKELMINYQKEKIIPIIEKLRRLITSLVCMQHEKSIGIFVSPFMEKVYYFTQADSSRDYFPPVLVQRDNGLKRYLKNT